MTGPSPALRADMESRGVDVGLTLSILESINSGAYDGAAPVEAAGVPGVDGRSIVPMGAGASYEVDEASAAERLGALGLSLPSIASSPGAIASGGRVRLGREALAAIGGRLLDRAAWGVLNGGSATSYADLKKNQSLGPGVFEAVRGGFELLSPLCEGRPKGLTPAYINPDGTPGESFLTLKMRAALLLAKGFVGHYGRPERPALPFFEMTSDATARPLAEAYRGYASHPWLKPLIEASGADPTEPRSAKQPLLAAFTHSGEGTPRRVFDRAYGERDRCIALPGGHGQGFRFLAGVYRGLLEAGYRYAWIGNVDNVGYAPDPAELAVMALSGAEAAFEFSYRTPVDVKGGVLVVDREGRRTVADIGQAISFDEVLRLESLGSKVLFNCATGLFDLARLVPRLDEIARKLPVRLSDQDKDAGKYSQAEQSTWEVVGLLDEPLGFAVRKEDRFIAAKLLAETVLSSGAASNPGQLPPGIAETAASMSRGLSAALSGPCGLILDRGRWTAPEAIK